MTLPKIATCALSVLLSCGIHLAAEEPQMPEFKNGKGGQLIELPLPKPEAFTSGERKGWKVKIPGGRPLATPAVVDGMLFIGGGFGSTEFYALNAKTGERVWSYKTGDDGPTAAVVAEGCVAYNTESCTLYVHEAKTGKLLWEHWLGDPLMSQPAISDGRLFMAYPSATGHHLVAFELKTGKVIWDRKIAADVITAPVADARFLCAATADGTLYQFDAATGKEIWSRQCNATSAPRIVGEKIYFSQRGVKDIEIASGEGADAKKTKSQATVEGFNIAAAGSGELAYKEPQGAVDAAYLLTAENCRNAQLANSSSNGAGQVLMRGYAAKAATLSDHFETVQGGKELKEELQKLSDSTVAAKLDSAEADAEKGIKLAEKLEALAQSQPTNAAADGQKDVQKIAKDLRDTAEKTKAAAHTAQVMEQGVQALQGEQQQALAQDSTVGFGGGAPEMAKAQAAGGNIGKTNVQAIWAYQGSRPCVVGDKTYCVTGAEFRSMSGEKFTADWKSKVESKVAASRPASTPALAGGKFYLATADGRILCISPADGKSIWESNVGGMITFEPAVAGGTVYAATNDGTLIALETGDAAADGWSMWGGSARHNGQEK